MKKHYNVVTYQMDECGRPQRLADKMLNVAVTLGLCKIIDRWVVDSDDGNAAAYVYTISGAKCIVDFLAKATLKIKGESQTCVIKVDRETGKIEDILAN